MPTPCWTKAASSASIAMGIMAGSEYIRRALNSGARQLRNSATPQLHNSTSNAQRGIPKANQEVLALGVGRWALIVELRSCEVVEFCPRLRVLAAVRNLHTTDGE